MSDDTKNKNLTPSSPLSNITRLSTEHSASLKRLGIQTLEDLLYHFPFRYGDSAKSTKISLLREGEEAVLFGRISKLETGKTWRGKMPISRAVLEDDTGKVKAIWFNQPYLAKMLKEDSLVKLEGVPALHAGEFSFANPRIEPISKIPDVVGESLFGTSGESLALYPVYPETRGVTSNWIYHTVQKIFSSGVLEKLEDPIPEDIRSKYSLPTLRSALIWIHTPKTKNDADAARKRFAFEEIFFLQIQKQRERKENKKLHALTLEHTKKDIKEFLKRFSFPPTKCQEKSIAEILSDFSSDSPMARLLHGDVGSGKTLVAATTAYAVTQNTPEGREFGNLQVALMAPTEILARQHFDSFVELFRGLNLPIALLTGDKCKKFPSKVDPLGSTEISKSQLLKWVEKGEIPILIGTHALIQKKVKFKNLAYVIIDEQHRFGTKQRKELARKDGIVPHLLSMSATPIPRTLALTIYGDLDISVLDEMPPGRKPITTQIVIPEKRDSVYDFMKTKFKEGRQAYVICPRINEPDPLKEKALNTKSVKEEAARLKAKVFKGETIDILHSNLSAKEKESVMQKFASGKTRILVATSVVEVGVNVPNATIILIEGAERFGLAQLHQLRGRVLRGNYSPYCFVFADTKTEKTIERLKAFENTSDGFKLAELDLKLRGSGEIAGGKQWGVSDLGMEAIKNIKLVEAAREEAKKIVAENEDEKNKLLREEIQRRSQIHTE